MPICCAVGVAAEATEGADPPEINGIPTSASRPRTVATDATSRPKDRFIESSTLRGCQRTLRIGAMTPPPGSEPWIPQQNASLLCPPPTAYGLTCPSCVHALNAGGPNGQPASTTVLVLVDQPVCRIKE